MKLSVAVISKSSDLEDIFLDRLSFADEILIITDQPISVTRGENKYKYFHRPLNGDFASQRNYAIEKASSDWIFFVDSDEVVSSQLADEIISKIGETKYSGFYLRRLDTIFNQLILHGETGNTRIIRLAKKKSGKFSRSVHEHWEIKGGIGELINPLFHKKDHFISEFLDRISLYGPIDAINLRNEGKPFNFFRLLAYPKAKFVQNYFFRKGFLDGYCGLFGAYLMSVQSLSVRVFQWTSKKLSSL